MSERVNQLIDCFFLSIVLLGLASCSEYWWSRGQAPGAKDLLKRSISRLEQTRGDVAQAGPGVGGKAARRAELIDISKRMQASLMDVIASVERGSSRGQLIVGLRLCRSNFIELEDELSVGSRVPYGELSGQMRVLLDKAEHGEMLDAPTLTLFSARTLFFLANEFMVPGPTVG